MSEITWQNTLPEQLLVDRFRITTGFHPEQRNIIEQLASGKRLLVIQRTGWGKSLCYQMASLYYPHLTIIFSPLKALMRDQCQRCNAVYEIPSAIVSSDFSEEENQITLELAIEGKLKLLYIAPERLNNTLWKNSILRMRISMIVIDEAHCISVWGHDFRPDYRRIVQLLNAIPEHIPVLGLTATANKRVEKDILQQMGGGAHIIRGTMQRPNLYLHTVQVQGDEQKLRYLSNILPHISGTGIIYTATKRHAEIVAQFLQMQGIHAEYYHVGRDGEMRKEIEQKFMGNKYKVVCSTNALGMGIDKQDIRFVIHYHIPGSPIHYYQEIGRAGRDGKVAWCTLLYDPEDLEIQRHFIQGSRPDSKQYMMIIQLLQGSLQGLSFWDIMRKTGFSQSITKKILTDLEDQHQIQAEQGPKRQIYTVISGVTQIDFSEYDDVIQQKYQELQCIEQYPLYTGCYMHYLTSYLGDHEQYACGVCSQCQPALFPKVEVAKQASAQVTYFIEQSLLPHIEKRGGKQAWHEAGWSLAFYNRGQIGELVRLSKYGDGGPFAPIIVERSVQVLQERYPIAEIDGVVSVPPTKSGTLVQNFVQEIARVLNIPYFSVIKKIRVTQEQKFLKNKVQKGDNIKGAFTISSPELVRKKTLLLVDDIYDSGQTLLEIAKTLRQAGAKIIYPFTITRTLHSDDQ